MYINDFLCIAPQKTYNLNGPALPLIKHTGNTYQAQEPDYLSLIPAAVLRRMAKYTRMGVGTALPLLKKHPETEAIIIGTANGGVDDTMQFLIQIEQYDEGTLTPTNFVKSTPNALSGALSMMCNNYGYNTTHVHEGLAFENALLDASMYMENHKKAKVLIGAAEEISQWNYNINARRSFYKSETTDSENLINAQTQGSVCGEGAVMFIVSLQKLNAVAKIEGTSSIMSKDVNDVLSTAQKLIPDDTPVDAIMAGFSGDIRYNHYYDLLYDKLGKQSGLFSFKNLCGDYPTVSSFALWLSACILNGYDYPEAICLKRSTKDLRRILIYNNYQGFMHGFILLSLP